MAAKSFVKPAIAVLCIGGSVAAIYNVHSDNSALTKRAEGIACGEKGCTRLLGVQRMPTSQTFTFQIQPNSGDTRTVECLPAYILFGEYACKLQ